MNYMVNDYFLGIRENIKLYHFGEGCIADYYGESIAYLDKNDINILMLCDGSRTVENCLTQISLIGDEQNTKERIKRLIQKGVLTVKGTPNYKNIVFFGEKGLYYPKQIAIELTSVCNYYCPFCYKSATSKGKFISDDDMKKIADIIDNKVEHVTFTGGEPTLHQHLIEYIDLYANKVPRVTMITNGSQLSEFNMFSSTLRKLYLIQFSLYGVDDNEYKIMTGAAKGYSNLERSIDFAKKIDVSVHLSLTLSETTIDRIDEFVDVAKKLCPDQFIIGFADNYGRAETIHKKKDLKEKYQMAIEKISQLRHKNKGVLNIQESYSSKLHGYKREKEDLKKYVYKGGLLCGSGTETIVISSNGKIRACHFLPEEMCSINESNALYEHIHGDFHNEQIIESTRKYIKNRRCQDCFEPCYAMLALMNGD